jgi:hypothetical protein
MIEAENLAAMIENQIKKTVDAHIAGYIKQTIEELILDPTWVDRIEATVNREFALKFAEQISCVDFNLLVNQHLDSALDRWKQRLVDNFETRGIQDHSQGLELTVLPGAVVAENELIGKKLQIQEDAEFKGDTFVNNLVVTGSINTDNASWDELKNLVADRTLEKIDSHWTQHLVKQVLDLARTQGIDFNQITVNGHPLVDDTRLSPIVTETNIKQLGTLRSLHVDGDARINDTLNVFKNRIGVNTGSPEMALSVWDEEVSVAMGKFKQNEAYIGTARLQKLSIGVNRQSYVEIDTDGLVRVNRLKIDQWRVDFSDKVPGHSGARGDIIFNTDPKPGTPFAWQCLGGFQWQAIRSAA